MALTTKSIEEKLNILPINFEGEEISDFSFKNKNLTDANFIECKLNQVEFENCNLNYADFSRSIILNSCFVRNYSSETKFLNSKITCSNFRNSCFKDSLFSYAQITNTSFVESNLGHSFFDYTILFGCNIFNTIFQRVNFKQSVLKQLSYFLPSQLLLADWGQLSNSLTQRAMAYDASLHPEPKRFDEWHEGGVCPYSNTTIIRACNFWEKRTLWVPGLPPPRAWDLMVDIVREKCADSDWHIK